MKIELPYIKFVKFQKQNKNNRNLVQCKTLNLITRFGRLTAWSFLSSTYLTQ